jgi:hypothetical protein
MRALVPKLVESGELFVRQDRPTLLGKRIDDRRRERFSVVSLTAALTPTVRDLRPTVHYTLVWASRRKGRGRSSGETPATNTIVQSIRFQWARTFIRRCLTPVAAKAGHEELSSSLELRVASARGP